MDSPSEDPAGNSTEAQCFKIRKQLDELLRMVDGLDERIGHFATSPEERRNLQDLKKRYSREALEMMMKIDYLEDPEDEDLEEFEDEEYM